MATIDCVLMIAGIAQGQGKEIAEQTQENERGGDGERRQQRQRRRQ